MKVGKIINVLFLGTVLSVVSCQKFSDPITEGMDNSSSSTQNEQKDDGGSSASQSGTGSNNVSGDNDYPIDKDNNTIDGHVIVFRDQSSLPQIRLTLLSLDEYEQVTSAYHSVSPQMAAEYASGYKEGTLTGWRIPSKEEGKTLKDMYGTAEKLKDLNSVIESLGGVPVYNTSAMQSNIRYLCEDATYTYCVKAGTSVTKAGANPTYYLRLLKDTIITVEN